MAYFHGVKASEVPTSIVAPVQTTAGLPVVFGTAPVHLTDAPTAYVNKPVICYSWTEAVAALGYSGDWDKYTLCEAMYSEFKLYAVKPIIFVNVLNPATHKTAVSGVSEDLAADKTVTLNEPVILSTLKVKASSEASSDAVLNTDYTAAYDDDGKLIITVLPDGALAENTSIVVTYDKVDPTAVTANNVIGGVDSSGNSTGLELIDQIYTLFSMVPGIVAAPGWSENPTVAAVMKAKSLNISELFRCICLTDVDTSQVTKYADVNAWKNNNNYTGTNQGVCWPCVRMGDMVFHMSTHLMGVIGVTDAANDDVPYQSPSNQTLQATGLCLKDGTEVTLSLPQANLLNSQGVITGLNFSGGWKLWGNYTGAYPSITDVKDSFICVRRMFDWQYQTFILTYWQKVDQPLTPRLVKTIVDSEQIRLNGLVSRGFLLGADVKFLEEENPTTDLLNGIIRVHSYITPPVPAQEIDDILEYDVNNFQTLFS
ncbi:MAG: phage tail sheath family protein [Anaerovibrio sp.]|uniref:phage tail sheath family protein n=1 Tax=Anaerovibrio sp. TaxID=1872532 RepID=UPI0025D83F02|nr:phage tail sheath family protein [Anaerovibrio sp.]MCR5176102.1 phage tail sheath family protein [Anaerovibrio sp.]